MISFNLTDERWIPIRWKPGVSETSSLVSLRDAFSRSREIADLDCLPHERISLIRLLVCITHAALGAPDDEEEWEDFAGNLETRVPAYLEKPEIRQHFHLLGDGPRFLQEKIPSKGEAVPASKLFPHLATGNNPTLLDHSAMDASRIFDPATLALGLLTFQNFYPLYGAGYKGRGPCSDGNAIHSLLLGKNLFETIRANGIDRSTLARSALAGLGKPIWECHTPKELEESAHTLLGRLLPRHRSLRLTDDLTGFHLKQESLVYPNWEPYREPSVSILRNPKNERRIVAARIDRAIWRDLHNLTTSRLAEDGNPDAAMVMQSHNEQLQENSLSLWTGALVTDLKAKILDTVESSFTVPKSLFSVAGHNLYAQGVAHAEEISRKLFGAIKAYGSHHKHESPPTEEGQKHYWHQLDQNHLLLIQLASAPRVGQPPIGSTEARDPWTQKIRTAALEAYALVCPRTTPRQKEAYVTGIRPLFKALYPKPKKAPQNA